MAGVGNSLT